MKLGISGWGIPVHWALQNFELLNRLSYIRQNFGLGRR